MKKFILLFSALILSGFTVNADTNNTRQIQHQHLLMVTVILSYLLKDGIEFSVFRDGQFDFNILNNSRLNVYIGHS